MSGGQAAVDYPKGKVSSIILSSNLIASATSVTTVRLQNLGLADQIGTLAAFLPSSIESLDLTNTLLTSFPAELGSLRLLKDLYEVRGCIFNDTWLIRYPYCVCFRVLDNNYITTVDFVEGAESITTL